MWCTALHEKSGAIADLRSVTCHIGSHSFTCHPTQVTFPALITTRQAGRYSFYLPRRGRRL